jgi:hypothetical protein
MKPASSSVWGAEFVPSRGRAIVVQVMLVLSVVVDLVAAGLIFVEVTLVGDVIAGRPVEIDTLQTNSDRVGAVGTASIFVLLVTAVAWWVWQYRGQANLLAAGRRGLDHKPWGAVGWWIVPIANLWMPFKTMRELWKASEPTEDPSAWAGVLTWPVLGWWWALWILGNLLQSASGFASESEDLDAIRASDITALAGLACSVFAACLAIDVIRQITRRQSMLASVSRQNLAAGSVEVPERPTEIGRHVPPRPDLG